MAVSWARLAALGGAVWSCRLCGQSGGGTRGQEHSDAPGLRLSRGSGCQDQLWGGRGAGTLPGAAGDPRAAQWHWELCLERRGSPRRTDGRRSARPARATASARAPSGKEGTAASHGAPREGGAPQGQLCLCCVATPVLGSLCRQTAVPTGTSHLLPMPLEPWASVFCVNQERQQHLLLLVGVGRVKCIDLGVEYLAQHPAWLSRLGAFVIRRAGPSAAGTPVIPASPELEARQSQVEASWAT